MIFQLASCIVVVRDLFERQQMDFKKMSRTKHRKNNIAIYYEIESLKISSKNYCVDCTARSRGFGLNTITTTKM